MQLVYIGFFSELVNGKRYCASAANNVSCYIKKNIEETDNEVLIINVSQGNKGFYYKKAKFKNTNKIQYIDVPLFSIGLPSYNLVSSWIYSFLKNNVKSDSKIIMYHSTALMKLGNRIKEKWDTTLQVEEIYADVGNFSFKKIKKEIDYINKFKKRIYSSDVFLFDKRLSLCKSVILYGAYQPTFDNVSTGIKRIVYCGTLSAVKSGVLNACKAMECLDSDYILDIYGYGSKRDLLMLKPYLSNRIKYLGCLPENELCKKLVNYSVGLSTQNSKLSFNQSSFPSKILTYLRCGLKVVCTNSESVTNSKLCNFVFISDDTPSSISQAILNAFETKKNDYVYMLGELDKNFKMDFLELIEG